MLLSLLWGTAVATGPEVERTAVVVGANEAPPGRARLRYAYHDAERVAQTLIEVGGFSEDQVIVLRDPEPTELLDTLAQVPASDMLVFFYSGHADDHQLFPSGAPLAIQTLQATLDRVPAKLRVGVLDACRGGGWTGTKGLVAAPSFPLPKPTQQGTVYLAASSGAEDAHEADVVSGGFFTHHWTAGLRGPADANADGRVTIDESFAYARAYTVRDSTVYAGEPQHPSFKMELRGRDPVVLADLRSQRSTLELAWTKGLITVHAIETGARVATLNPRPEGYRLALRPGRWLVRRQIRDAIDVVEVELRAGASLHVDESDLVSLGHQGRLASKGTGVRFTELMSPRKGQWMVQFALGSRIEQTPEARVERELIWSESWVVGLTNRLSLSPLTPNLGFRIGRRGATEVQLTAGLLNGGFGYSRELGVLIGGDLGAALEVRVPTSARLSLQTSWGVARPGFVASRRETGTEDVWSRLALGVGWRISRDVTLHPSLSYGLSSSFTPGNRDEALVFGSTLIRNNRRLPLIQVALSNGVTLDAHYQFRYNLVYGLPNHHVLLGMTFASRKVGP